MEIFPAQDNLNLLTPQQRFMWDFLSPTFSEGKPLNKSDINPVKMTQCLPNLWMNNLFFNDKGILTDIQVRLMGTKTSEMVGERTGEYILTDNSKTALKHQTPEAYYRIVMVVKEAIATKTPLIYTNLFFSEDKKNYKSIGLVFPVCNQSDAINIIFGNTDFVKQ